MLTFLALVGATLIIVESTLFRRIRGLWPSMLKCPQCAGMWVGAAAGGCGLMSAGHGRILDAIIVGSAVSFSSLLASAVLLNLLGDLNEETKP